VAEARGAGAPGDRGNARVHDDLPFAVSCNENARAIGERLRLDD
jgi:hypothetical protein